MSNRKKKGARTRRQFSTEEKAAILRRHLVDKTPVADICNELSLQPSLFYQWLRQVHENLAGALAPAAPTEPSKRRLARLVFFTGASPSRIKARMAVGAV